MERHRQYILYILIGFSLSATLLWANKLEAKNFLVVIDAGHGGHDPGAVGKFSKEKNINLNVALKLGKLIEKNCTDVDIVYTRRKDAFIPLARRAEIANNAKADLFISIHTNALANNKTMRGASTWTLGLAKSDANLAVAQRENSVILYENDYKTRYAGFNPNSAESYIIFEFMQDKYMSQSVHLASLVQKELHNTCKRADRGVHQAGFLVLKASAMPSILVELGFISTPVEEQYLNSEAGTTSLANGIYRAFLTYKQEQEVRLKKDDKKETPQTQVTTKGEIVFKVQILASSRALDSNNKLLKGVKDVDCYRENNLYKYTYGSSTDYNRILRIKRSISAKFKDAFVIAFKNGKKMDIQEAIKEFENRNKK